MKRRRLASMAILGALACATLSESPPPAAKAPDAPAAAQPSAPAKGESVVTESKYTDIHRGPGADNCADMDRAAELMKTGKLADAEPLVDSMLAKFTPQIEARGGIPVSVANQAQYDEVRAASSTPERLVPLDWCYRELLHWKAFIKAGQEDYTAALAILEQEARAAPTAASPYVERGYILNRLGRYPEAKSSYERAIEIGEKYAPSAPDIPMALRGLGYSLIELGDLDAAQAAFDRSLMLEPGNAVATRELAYIKQLRAKEP